jgi:hypothetical protein
MTVYNPQHECAHARHYYVGFIDGLPDFSQRSMTRDGGQILTVQLFTKRADARQHYADVRRLTARDTGRVITYGGAL